MRIKKTVETLVAAVTSTDVAAIEHELAKLEQRRAQLTESLDAATHTAIDASAIRRELIIANRDQGSLEEANSKVREAEERRVALDDAWRALDQKITDTTKRLDEAKAEAERIRIADLLEQRADVVRTTIAALEKVAKSFGEAFRQLETALTPAIPIRAAKQGLNRNKIAAFLAAEALAASAPGLFVDEYGDGGIGSVLRRAFPVGAGEVKRTTRDRHEIDNPVGAHRLAETLIMSPWRAKAAAIRTGEEPAVLPTAHLMPQREPPPPERHVLFLKPVSYIGKAGLPVIHAAWTAHVPKIVGDVAIERGLALDADAEEGRVKLKEMMELRQRPWQGAIKPQTVEETIDLGLNLSDQLERRETAA